MMKRIPDFFEQRDYLVSICEKHNIDTFTGDMDFVIYPQGYNEGVEDKKYYFIILSKNDFDDLENFNNVLPKNISEKEFIKGLKEFNKGIFNDKIFSNNIVDMREDFEDFKYCEDLDDNLERDM